MNKIELQCIMLRKGVTITELSKQIKCDRTTLYRKMESGRFERSEIIRIREALNLTEEEMLHVFFDDEGCENATGKE